MDLNFFKRDYNFFKVFSIFSIFIIIFLKKFNYIEIEAIDFDILMRIIDPNIAKGSIIYDPIHNFNYLVFYLYKILGENLKLSLQVIWFTSELLVLYSFKKIIKKFFSNNFLTFFLVFLLYISFRSGQIDQKSFSYPFIYLSIYYFFSQKFYKGFSLLAIIFYLHIGLGIWTSVPLSLIFFIYNYKSLIVDILGDKYTGSSDSDSEVIIYLYKEYGINCIKMLDGIFSFILYDIKDQKVIIARDPIGVIPLYHGYDLSGSITIASELKCFHDVEQAEAVTPGSYMTFDYTSKWIQGETEVYYTPEWKTTTFSENVDEEQIKQTIKSSLVEAVEKRLMADVPFGVLLSGGLDSSLIASIASKSIKAKDPFCGKLHTFSIGLKNSPDILAARKVADYLQSDHHELSFTVQDGLDSIKDLIYHLFLRLLFRIEKNLMQLDQ